MSGPYTYSRLLPGLMGQQCACVCVFKRLNLNYFRTIVLRHSNRAIKNIARNLIVSDLFIIIQDLRKMCLHLCSRWY